MPPPRALGHRSSESSSTAIASPPETKPAAPSPPGSTDTTPVVSTRPSAAGILKADGRVPHPEGLVPGLPNPPLDTDRGPACGHHRRLRSGVLQRRHPDRHYAPQVPGHARGGSGNILRAGAWHLPVRSQTPTRRLPSRSAPSCRCPSFRGSSSRSTTAHRRGCSGSHGYSRSCTSPRGCLPASWARPSTGSMCSSWPPGGSRGCCSRSASSVGNRAPSRRRNGPSATRSLTTS